MRPRALLLTALWCGAAVAATDSPLRLETVLPGAPGKNNVRWWEFDWKYSEFEPVRGGAPVRLFFYEDERAVAEVARPEISEAYADLARDFGYTPKHRIPFLLYNSHFEFESAREFFISEGILGVTSTEDLSMALPYWGEHQRFQHVLRHEMAHQFTIQKVRDLGERQGCNPLMGFPLWFIEGIAERFSQPSINAEVRAVLADWIVDGKPQALPAYFEEGAPSFARVYLAGHAQVRFLDEVYGNGTVQRILDAAPRMCGRGRQSSGFLLNQGGGPFPELVSHVIGEPAPAIDARWKEWARKQIADALDASHALAEQNVVDNSRSEDVDSFSLSPDGRTVFYRAIDRDSGMARLYLRDVTRKGPRVLVTQDHRAGLESLHPIDRRVSAIGSDRLAYIGRVGSTDVLFVRRFERKDDGDRVRFEIGPAVEHDLSKAEGLIEGGHPAIAPDGAVAFVGLSRRSGFLDVYRFERPLEDDPRLVRVTDDPYAEQALSFGPDGALYYASDATPDGRYEIFRLDGSAASVLTSVDGDVDASNPAASSRGVVFQTAATGFTQAFALQEGAAVQLTDVPTFLHSPAIDARGAILGIAQLDGRRRLVEIAQPLPAEVAARLPTAATQAGTGGGGVQPWQLRREPLGDVNDYRPLALGNFSLLQLAGAAASGPYVVAQAIFADRFKSHLFLISAEVLGELERGNAEALYIDQSGRTSLGGGIFARTGVNLVGDPAVDQSFFFMQRFGATFLAQYPFGRFTRLEGFISPQVIRGFDFSDSTTEFARDNSGLAPAIQAGLGYGVDTLRLSGVGPYDGIAFSIGGDVTIPFGRFSAFGTATTELQVYKNLLRGYERLFLHGRLALGTSLGGAFREDFYLPAAHNLRAFPDNAFLDLIGNHYYLSQLELQFPLLPALGGFFLQGVAGVDAGGIFFDPTNNRPLASGGMVDEALGRRQAAAVLGANAIFGPLSIRFHMARPFSIGTPVLYRGWIPHFTIATPFFAL